MTYLRKEDLVLAQKNRRIQEMEVFRKNYPTREYALATKQQEFLMFVGKELRLARRRQGLSLDDVAFMSEGLISKPTLSLIENGKQNIYLRQYEFLSRLYRCYVAPLYEG